MTARQERGSVTLELTVLAPALLVMLGLVIVAGRFESAAASVEQAAAAGARSASLQRTAAAAQLAAVSSVHANLARGSITCEELDIAVAAAGFRAMAGTPAEVSVTVTCSLRFDEQGIPGLPGSRQVRAQVVSPLDAYRGR